MGNYRQLTIRLLDLCDKARRLLKNFDELNVRLHTGLEVVEKRALLGEARSAPIGWYAKCREILREHDLDIDLVQFDQTAASPAPQHLYNVELNEVRGLVSARIDLLASIAQRIEAEKSGKNLTSITIDDLDNFPELRGVSPTDVSGFAESAFLEDDVEEAFLAAIGEPYKEPDSGAETRDLFTNRISLKGKRLSTAIMFKGRGVRGPLSLRDCGAKGSQLLKLAKNNAAECFLLQHVNKIEPDVKETLIDLVLMNTRHPDVYVGFIDGVDTARFLKSRDKNLAELARK